jgi:flagellar protein FliL
LRNAVLDLMRQVTEADLAKPNFRRELAANLKAEMNAVLEKYEDFGGIEEVYFTNFVVQ